MRRVALIGIIALAIAWVLLAYRTDGARPSAPTADPGAVPSDISAGAAGHGPRSPAGADTIAPMVGSAEGTQRPVTPTAAPSGRSDLMPSPERPVRGSSVTPSGGKPVAPIDLEWDLAVAGDGSRAFRGTVTLVTRSGPARIAATFTGVQGATATGTTTFAFDAVESGRRIVLPIAGQAAAGAAPGGVTVAVTYTTSDTRGRVVLIELRDPALAAPPPAVEAVSEAPGSTQGSTPLQGVHVIRDDRGELIILQPSTPPKR